MERPSVRSETQGAVTTIILDRPDRRNAIDRPTAKALAAAFRAFERDQGARVVARGQARHEAEALAATIAAFPPHSVGSDRRSAHESLGARLPAALRREYVIGAATFNTGESIAGAQRFASGAGRHGKF